LLAKRRAAASVGTSTHATLPSPTTSAPNSSTPAHVNKRKGVVVETSSEDEDTGSGLVFKRHRVSEVVAPSHSASSGLTPTFRDNPPSASCPRDLIVLEGGRENALEDH